VRESTVNAFCDSLVYCHSAIRIHSCSVTLPKINQSFPKFLPCQMGGRHQRSKRFFTAHSSIATFFTASGGYILSQVCRLIAFL